MTEGERFTSETGPKTIQLHDILDASREVPHAYKPLILAQEQAGANYPTLYYDHTKISEAWDNFKIPPHARDFLQRRLAGSVLVDLGGFEGDMQKLAHQFQVATYINVDRDIGEKDTPANPLAALRTAAIEGLHRIDVKADMLDFVARMRDGSANFILNGIDTSIIQDRRYHEALAQELVRTTQKGGIVFGFASEIADIWEDMVDRSPLKNQFTVFASYKFFAFEKPE